MNNEKPARPPVTIPLHVEPLERPERRFSILLIGTALAFGFVGSATGALVLASLSGVPTGLGQSLFPSHPYLQIYGFVTEFVVGVAYSLLPRFKGGRIPHLSLGYVIYGAVTSANVLFILPAVMGQEKLLDLLGSLLVLVGSAAYTYQAVELMKRPTGGFPESNPLVVVSSVSLILASILQVLATEGLAGTGGPFSPELVFLSLVGFAGSQIYAVQIRTVSFRQCNYRKRTAKLASLLQAVAVGVTFASAVTPARALSVLGGVLFLAAALGVLLSARVLELVHPLMVRPAMTKMHYTIMRYNEVCLLSAAAWLLLGCVAGTVWLWAGAETFPLKDSFIHSIAIGFIGSNITCFAPMLLPGLLGRRGPSTALSFGPIALLDAGILVRLLGNFQTSMTLALPIWESSSGLLVIAAMVWLLMTLRNALGSVQGQAQREG